MHERILVIEDEEKIARFIELELQYEGYRVEKAGDGREGLERFEKGAVDLVLLDIMLPGLNGMEVLRRIRRNADTPVILLTARDSVTDKVFGLDGGANDYLTKPFAIEELLARIRAHLRGKSSDAAVRELTAGDLQLSPARHEARYGDAPLELTKREFDLLQILLENKNIVLSRDVLLEKVWGYDYLGETNVVDVYIRYLRAKIDDVFHVKLVHTVRGVGYTIRDDA